MLNLAVARAPRDSIIARFSRMVPAWTFLRKTDRFGALALALTASITALLTATFLPSRPAFAIGGAVLNAQILAVNNACTAVVNISFNGNFTYDDPGAGEPDHFILAFTDLEGDILLYQRASITATEVDHNFMVSMRPGTFPPTEGSVFRAKLFEADSDTVPTMGDLGSLTPVSVLPLVLPADFPVYAVNSFNCAATTDDVFIGFSTIVVVENVEDIDVAFFTLQLADGIDPESYTLTIDHAKLEIDSARPAIKLKDGMSLDHETDDTLTVTVTATPDIGDPVDFFFDLTVLDLPEAPTAITIDHLLVDPDVLGAPVGQLTVADEDDDIHFFQTNQFNFFVGQNNILRLIPSAKLTDGQEVDVLVRATDSDGLFFDQIFTITASNVPDPPTDIILARQEIDQMVDGAHVGPVTVTDRDLDETHGFVIDDTRFEIVDMDGVDILKLKAGEEIDFDAEETIAINIEVTDKDEFMYDEDFTITVKESNDEPSGLTLDSLTILDNVPGAAVGLLTVVDDDEFDIHYFEIDDPMFEVVGSTLKLKAGERLLFRVTPTVDIEIKVTDGGGGPEFIETFTIEVIDPNAVNAVAVTGPATAAAQASTAVNIIAQGIEGGFTVGGGTRGAGFNLAPTLASALIAVGRFQGFLDDAEAGLLTMATSRLGMDELDGVLDDPDRGVEEGARDTGDQDGAIDGVRDRRRLARHRPVRFWGVGSYTGLENKFLSGSVDRRFEGETLGFSLGADMIVRSKFLIGLSAGYIETDLDTVFNVNGTYEEQLYTVAPYAAIRLDDHFTFWVTGGGGLGDVETTRANGTITGSADSSMLFAAASMKGRYETRSRPFVFSGSVGLLNASKRIKQFIESNGTGVAETTTRIKQMRADGEIGYRFDLGSISLTPFAESEISYDYGDTVNEDKFGTEIGGGLRLTSEHGLAGSFRYSQEIGRVDFNRHTIEGALQYGIAIGGQKRVTPFVSLSGDGARRGIDTGLSFASPVHGLDGRLNYRIDRDHGQTQDQTIRLSINKQL